MVLLLVFGTLIFLLLIVFCLLIVVRYRKKHNEHALEKQRLLFAYKEELLQSRIEVQEQTFKQISQELHDNIGQMLTLVKLHLNTIDTKLSHDTNESILNAKDVLSRAIRDLRDLSKTMNSDTITQLGILHAIELELKAMEKLTGINTACECNETVVSINPQVELILFRIVQEALHNVIKHARASIIHVSTAVGERDLEMIITDDGVGFDLNNKLGYGSGLMNITSRCKLINASLNLESAIGVGTKITLKVPLIS
jgi:signal transduction histidine kinase